MTIKTLYRNAFLAPLAGVAALGLVAGSAQSAGEFDGVEVNIMTFTGPQIAEPLQRRAPDFNAMTGATINIVTVPFSDLYSKVLTDWAAGTNSIDAAVFAPQWAVDYVVPGFLENLSERVAGDAALQEDDIAQFFREFSQKFAGDTYMLTLDGDFQMVYYRSDVFADAGIAAPETWQDYAAAAEALHGQDMNGDGTPDYGSCISKKRSAQAYWMILSIAGGYLQSQGTSQGIFFDTDTMAPLVNNEAFAAALDIYTATTAFGRRTRSTSTWATRGACSLPAAARSPSTGAISARSPSTRRPHRSSTRWAQSCCPARPRFLTVPPASSCRAMPRPAPTPSTGSTVRRSRHSAAGPAASMPMPTTG